MLKATVKSAEEITGQKGCIAFEGECEGGAFSFTKKMNEMAGKELILKEYDGGNSYDYRDCGDDGCCWRKDWLKNIREEVDWSKVPVDAKVIVIDRTNYHFAGYKDGLVGVWKNGRTSWAAKNSEDDISWWNPENVRLA